MSPGSSLQLEQKGGMVVPFACQVAKVKQFEDTLLERVEGDSLILTDCGRKAKIVELLRRVRPDLLKLLTHMQDDGYIRLLIVR